MTRHRLVPTLCALVAATAGCDDDITATVVTLKARPAVRPLASVEVTFSNDLDGKTETLKQTFDLRGVTLPATFSVSTPGRTGEITMTAVGRNADGAEAALGRAVATILPDEVGVAGLVLDPTDFLVNTTFAGSQQLAFIAGNNGRQLAATAAGEFTIAFSDDGGGLGRFDVWGRTFDVRSQPLRTVIAAGDAQFNFNRSDVFGNDPAIAVGPAGHRVAVFSSGVQLFCSAISPDGSAVTAAEVVLGAGPVNTPGTTVGQPSIVTLAAARYAVAWAQLDATSGQPVVKAKVVDDACATTADLGNVSTDAGNLDRPSVAGVGTRFGIVWGNSQSLRGRFTGDDGRFPPGRELTIVPAVAGGSTWGQQVVATDEGYLLAFSNAPAGSTEAEGEGSLRVRRLSKTGTLLGVESILATDIPVLISAPALTRRSDGAVALAWHVCDIVGDPECGIRGLVLRGTGLPIGQPFTINTTTNGIQIDPSIVGVPDGFVVAWTDVSKTAPDTSDESIRARVIYPTFDEAVSILGARCGNDTPACGENLACLAGSDGVAHCHATCDPAGPSPACPAGGVCTTTAGVSGCIF